MFLEMFVRAEVVVLAVLEDEDTILGQQLVLEDEVGNLRKFLQCIRWVGKDQIELLMAALQKPEHVAFNQYMILRMY